MNDADNVQQFPGAPRELPENPLQITRGSNRYCTHPSVVIDEHARQVTCADTHCGAVLDAFDFLRTNAHTIARAWEYCRHVRSETEAAAQRLSVLKKEEKRLREAVKRLQAKLPIVSRSD